MSWSNSSEIRWRTARTSSIAGSGFIEDLLLFQHEAQELCRIAAPWCKAPDFSVESCQPTSPPHGQGEKMSVGNLAIAYGADVFQEGRGRQRDIVVPELMLRQGNDATQEEDRFLRAGCVRNCRRV